MGLDPAKKALGKKEGRCGRTEHQTLNETCWSYSKKCGGGKRKNDGGINPAKIYFKHINITMYPLYNYYMLKKS
jgi:hypothetical protein